MSWFQLFRMPNTSRSRPARHRGLLRTIIFICGTAFLFCSIISKTGPECDSALRDIVRIYPYDVAPGIDTTGDGQPDDGSLRGSSEVVAERIRAEIQEKVEEAGLEVLEARITYLAYAPEIAAVMLQRQQASAIIDARKMIVDGAVGMVEMALERLNENKVVELDDERKAAMVSNLLVVLCGNHDAQPVVNSGSLY